MRGRVRPRLPYLLHDPDSVGISCHIEAQDRPPVMPDNKEAIQHAKGHRWHGEEINGREGLPRSDFRLPCEKSALGPRYSMVFGHRPAEPWRAISNTGESRPDANPPRCEV